MSMSEGAIKKFAADIAKEVTVAKATNTNLPYSAENGQKVADFYNALYNGIVENLVKNLSNEN